MPLEGMPAQEIRDRFGRVDRMLEGRLPRGSYTDDTEMMIGVAESLLERGGFDGGHMAARFLRNLQGERGYGQGTMMALEEVRQGVPWQDAGARAFPGGSWGNGAAMRVAPLALVYVAGDLQRFAGLSSLITHTHPLGLEGAILQAEAVSLALATGSVVAPRFLRALKGWARTPEYLRALEDVEALLVQDPTVEEVVAVLGSGSTALRSVPTAIYCFLREPRSFKDAVTYGVNLGGDTDTVGAMTGAIAGAFHGACAIPPGWYEALEGGAKGKAYVEDLARGLWNLAREKNPGGCGL
jgi:poly(ADP-ribose) glycohydrolase ARH3